MFVVIRYRTIMSARYNALGTLQRKVDWMLDMRRCVYWALSVYHTLLVSKPSGGFGSDCGILVSFCYNAHNRKHTHRLSAYVPRQPPVALHHHFFPSIQAVADWLQNAR